MVTTTTLLTLLTVVSGLELSSICRGDVLRGPIVGHHRNPDTKRLKLFVRVPVERPGRGGEAIGHLDAVLNLPLDHPLAGDPAAAYGQKLNVRALRAQPASARLSVVLAPPPSPPRPPGLEGLSQRARARRAATDTEAYPHRLEDVAIGTPVNATVLRVRKFGAFVEVGVSRCGRGGRRAPVDALLPADQLPSGVAPADMLIPGARLDGVRVLRPSPGSGRLLVTAVPVADAAALTSLLEERLSQRRRAARRPSLSALARQPGSEREGIVVSISAYGAVVNVGARRPGLIHISQMSPKGSGRGFVEDVSEVMQVGDRVVVTVLARSTARKLALRLVKVFPRDEADLSQARALLRKGEALLPRHSRAEDGGARRAVEVAIAADEEAAWAAYQGVEDTGEAAGSDEEDPWAWAAASELDEQAEEDDPWAWAAADPRTDSDASDPTARAPEDDVGGEDGPQFEQSYFEDKYDIDTY